MGINGFTAFGYAAFVGSTALYSQWVTLGADTGTHLPSIDLRAYLYTLENLATPAHCEQAGTTRMGPHRAGWGVIILTMDDG